MFSHVMIGANNVEESKQFYDAILGALGHGPGVMDDQGRCFYFTDTGIFAITQPIDGPPGVREGGIGKLYLAYLRDPAGNKLCALHRMG
jgi:catechol 2,3-dioxygenase-like lactoylglutathione lyase family enzyme